MTENRTHWNIDPLHSEVQFKVKHLAISNVAGVFNTFSGVVETEGENFTNAKIHFEINTNSIDTNNAERDKHLKSEAFFHSEKYPTMLFNGSLLQDGELFLEGNLTILATTKKVRLNVEHTGIGMGRFGDTRAGFEVSGKINRKDFGLTFSLLTETGNLVVGEEVKLHFDIQLIKQ